MALTLTSREEPYKKGFGPFVPEVYRARYPGFAGGSLADSLADVSELIRSHEIAAVILEPIQGEAGFIVPPETFLDQIRQMCEAHDVLLIFDEVQSGYGRTGRFLASHHADAEADIVVLGKAIGAGLPLSAIVVQKDLTEQLPTNSLGGTYPGNPVACAAGLAVLDVIEDEGLIERATEIGVLLKKGWEDLAHVGIREIRGVGAMVGVEFEDAQISKKLVTESLQRGVMMMTAGREGRVIRHLLPLVITDGQLDEVFDVLSSAIGG